MAALPARKKPKMDNKIVLQNSKREVEKAMKHMHNGRVFDVDSLEQPLDDVVKAFENNSDDDDFDVLKSIIKPLKAMIQYTSNQIDDMKKIVQTLEERVQKKEGKLQNSAELRRIVREKEDLERRVKELEGKVAELEKIQIDLIGGEIVRQVKDLVIEKVIEGTGVSRKRFLSISQLDKAVTNQPSQTQSGKIFRNERQAKQAKENWDKVNIKLNLDDAVYGALEELRTTRNTTAHPNMTLEEARTHIKAFCMFEEDREMFLQLLDILDKAGVRQI